MTYKYSICTSPRVALPALHARVRADDGVGRSEDSAYRRTSGSFTPLFLEKKTRYVPHGHIYLLFQVTAALRGYVLAEDVHAPHDAPLTATTNVDGYAVRCTSFSNQPPPANSSYSQAFACFFFVFLFLRHSQRPVGSLQSSDATYTPGRRACPIRTHLPHQHWRTSASRHRRCAHGRRHASAQYD